MKLSIVDNEVILSVIISHDGNSGIFNISFELQGYSHLISNELIEFNKKFDRLCAESKSSIFSTLSNMVIFPISVLD